MSNAYEDTPETTTPDDLFGPPGDDELAEFAEFADELADTDDDLSDDEPDAGDEPGGETADNVVDLSEARARRRSPSDDMFGWEFFASVNVGGKVRTMFLPEQLANAILDMGPLAVGQGDQKPLIWAYDGGVWKIAMNEVRDRATELLRENYKPDRATAAEHHLTRMLRRSGRVIDGKPRPDIINFKNGILFWKTGEFIDHTPDILSTVQLNTEWVEGAECPEFDAFLASVLPEDLIETVWELIGYTMFSGNPLHKAVMCIGSGRNGKGTLLRAITALLGERNVTSVDLHSLTTERFATVSLYNKLANIAGDIEARHLKNTAKFKQITGEDTIYAEYKGKDGFDFRPWAVPIFSANEIPSSSDASAGYLARWLVLKFPYSFEGCEDRTLTDRITTPEELRGIAYKGVLALRRLMERGNFPETESSREAMAEFRRANDPCREWFEERCDVNPDWPPVNRKVFYDDYKEWCFENGKQTLSSRKFYERLRSYGITERKSNGYPSLFGVKLLPKGDLNSEFG